MKKALNVANYASLKDGDHIVIFRPNSRKVVFMGKVLKSNFTLDTSDNAIVITLTHPDGSVYCITAHSVKTTSYDYEKGRIFVMNDSLTF